MSDSETLYTAKVHVVGGRQGGARSSDGRLDIQLSPPGAGASGSNPEQLFAAGWAACFQGAMAIAAKSRGVSLPAELAIDAEVDLGLGGDGYVLAARLNVSVPGVDRALAGQIIEAAHRTCPYSRAVKGNIDAVISLV